MTFEKNTIEGEAINIDDIAARSETVEIDPAEEKKLVRKIDWKLMPVLCFTYALQYYDKAILSQAAVFGLREDLQLTDGLRYSWVSLIFYFGYLIGTYPLSFLAQKYPPRIICAIICLLWAVVIICTPAAGSYGGLLANRFLLGVTEAGVSPIFMLVVGMWYTHPEQVLRSSFWYSFSGGSLVISPLINYGLGHISGAGLHPWQYMYLIAGATTFLWGIALWWLFPETPRHAPGFDEHERSLLLERIKANNAGSENHDFKLHHVREALSDYQFWGLILLSITTCTGGGVINTFSSIVFNGMGFSNFQSLLLNLPNGGMAFFCILGSGYIGRMVPNSRLYIVAASSFPVILGCALLWKLPDSMRGGRIVGFYLINCFSSGWVQCIGLGTSNVAGHTKKSVYAAGTFVGYSVGNIVGPLVFDAKYAPRYKESFIGIMVCFSVSFIVSLCLRALLARENTKRQSKYGDPELSHGLEDLTDGENMSFRYNL